MIAANESKIAEELADWAEAIGFQRALPQEGEQILWIWNPPGQVHIRDYAILALGEKRLVGNVRTDIILRHARLFLGLELAGDRDIPWFNATGLRKEQQTLAICGPGREDAVAYLQGEGYEIVFDPMVGTHELNEVILASSDGTPCLRTLDPSEARGALYGNRWLRFPTKIRDARFWEAEGAPSAWLKLLRDQPSEIL